MKRKIPIVKITAIIIALVFLSLGGLCFYAAHRWKVSFFKWASEETIRLNADLSKRGVYSGNYERNYNMMSHGEYLYVEMEEEINNEDESLRLVKGVKGNISAKDANGTEKVSYDFFDQDFMANGYYFTYPANDANSQAPAILLRNLPVSRKYIFTVTIDEPATALSNIEHTLVGRHMVCGCELLATTYLSLIGSVSAGLGILILIVVYFRISKQRKKTLAAQSDTGQESRDISSRS